MEKKRNTYCSCLYYSANALSRVLTRMAEEAFAVTGLAPSYAFLLMTVNEHPGIQPKEISTYMQLSPSTVTRLLEKMEHKKFITRKPAGRMIAVHPTPRGIALHAALKAAWESLYRNYTALLGEQQARLLTTAIYETFEKLNKTA